MRWAAEPVFQSRATGMGHHEHPRPPMGRAGMGSTHHQRPAGVARRFQSGEHPVRAVDAQRRDVLSDYPIGSAFLDQPQHLEPEGAAPAVEAGPRPGVADVLAGEAAAQHLRRGHAVGSQPFGGELSDIGIAAAAGPVPGQDGAGEWVGLAESDRSHPGALQSECQTADAAEQVENIQGCYGNRKINIAFITLSEAVVAIGPA